jgi:hypothetical protein
MPKLKTQKTNPLDEVNKRIEQYVETYDSPLMHDPLSNSFKTENQIKHEAGAMEQKKKVPKMSATDTYNLYKTVASPAERKEFKQIEQRSKPLKERKVYKAKMAALDAQVKKSISTPIPKPMDLNVNLMEKKVNYLLDDDKTLERLEAARNKPDPDYFRGLGIFLPKKI